MARQVVTTDIYTQRAEARLGKAIEKIKRAGVATTKDLVNIGKETARILVPKQTLFLYRSIQGETKPAPDGSIRGRIYIDPYITPDFQKIYPKSATIPNFSLVRWMHETGGKFKSDNAFGKKGTQHIVSGDPYFMFTTRQQLNRMARGTAEGTFKALNL
jgi:hypothetical protein